MIALLDKAPFSLWHYREWGVRALAVMGRKAEAIRYAEASRSLNDNPIAIARACKEILLSSGLAALRWIAAGYGYEITGVDVLAACSNTLAAARNGG